MEDYVTLTLPMTWNREVITIDADLATRGYIIFEKAAVPESVEFKLEDQLDVIDPDQYKIFRIDKDNNDLFPDAESGDVVLSWIVEDVEGEGLQEVIDNLIGYDIDVKYAVSDLLPDEPAEPVDNSDNVNWEETDSSSSSSS